MFKPGSISVEPGAKFLYLNCGQTIGRLSMLQKLGLYAACVTLLAISSATHAQSVSVEDKEWKLVWADEFEGSQLNPENWSIETDCWGGGNKERQCYTTRNENVRVQNGYLYLTARLEWAEGPALPPHLRETVKASQRNDVKRQPFTSGRIRSKGKASWLYGRFEVRAKLPKGQGTWPAIWMLPETETYGAWAASGEIDIVESVNRGTKCDICPDKTENRIYGTLHFGREWPHNKYKGQEYFLPKTEDGFHIFAMEWEEGEIRWYADGEHYFTLTSDDWRFKALFSKKPKHAPFDHAFHLVMNLAIGGHLPEDRNLGGVSVEGYPKSLEVDWVRVYQRSDELE